MIFRTIVLALLFICAGCAELGGRAGAIGSTLIDQRNDSAAAALALGRDYMCRGAPIGAIMTAFNTDELREAWRTICKRDIELP